jgi:hypothetical protein
MVAGGVEDGGCSFGPGIISIHTSFYDGCIDFEHGPHERCGLDKAFGSESFADRYGVVAELWYLRPLPEALGRYL